MIVYLSTTDHAYTIGDYLEGPGAHQAGRIVHRTYVDILGAGTAGLAGMVPATWIFSDLERLLPPLATRAAGLWRHLEAAGCRLLNHPTRGLRRYEMLRVLHDRGMNDFDVCRVTDRRLPRRYPVFLRRDDNHSGPVSALIGDAPDLRHAIGELHERGWPRQKAIIVEFSDTADSLGLYRKYGAFRIGEAIVPGHMDTSRGWSVKDADLDWPEERARELRFLDDNPWEADIRRIFELARIDYGRIDFSVRPDGRFIVWEINTNPLIASPASLRPDRAPVAQRLFPQIATAFEALDGA
ncbi:hypothetical protein EDC65_1909 [Stella humosa]|uniref:ATP-grasp domain-containing protein n=1 Tax=Stella humosa TaxID=94 RepID=A0A3N1M8S4_9PROT|nr:hypothetical protein [Stella humosa]ROQ00113.1 hypothetical protein EDC65_1909 [Stella humosa]BBK30653.1 hypothetical protein STHU_12870 [Stella humosa]